MHAGTRSQQAALGWREPAGALGERLLGPGGRLVMTVPHPVVDYIVGALVRLGVAEGMDLEAHHGFDVCTTEPMFTDAGFRLVPRRAFELDLNRLYVFEKPADRT